MRRKVLTILLVISVLVICIGGGIVYQKVQEETASDAALDEIAELKPDLIELPEDQVDGSQSPGQTGSRPSEKTNGSRSVMDFAGIKTKNPDVIAWLTIPGTVIDYPIVQSKDNSYYLTHDAKKKKNLNGALFLDYRVHSDFSDFNSVVYGHHMKSGRMFQNLIKFKDQSFWNSHSTATLYTPEHTYRLEFIAVAVVQQNSPLYRYAFPSPTERLAHLEEIKSAAKFYRDVGLTENDRIVTLSTCSYEFKNARTVLVAKICG